MRDKNFHGYQTTGKLQIKKIHKQKMGNRLPKLKLCLKLSKEHIQIDIYHNPITKAHHLNIIGGRSTSSFLPEYTASQFISPEWIDILGHQSTTK
jgi:hypothetical protein